MSEQKQQQVEQKQQSSKGLRVKVAFRERQALPGIGAIQSFSDGWLRPDGLVRIDHQNPHADFDHLLIPASQLESIAVYRKQG